MMRAVERRHHCRGCLQNKRRVVVARAIHNPAENKARYTPEKTVAQFPLPVPNWRRTSRLCVFQ